MALKSALKRPHLWLVFERIADETINSNWIQLKSKNKLEINATGDVGLEKINAKVIGWANKRDQRWIKQGEEGVSYKNFKNQIIKKSNGRTHKFRSTSLSTDSRRLLCCRRRSIKPELQGQHQVKWEIIEEKKSHSICHWTINHFCKKKSKGTA